MSLTGLLRNKESPKQFVLSVEHVADQSRLVEAELLFVLNTNFLRLFL